MAESMKSVETWIQAILRQAGLKPLVEFVSNDLGEIAKAVWDLEHRILATVAALAQNVHQTEDGLDRREHGMLSRAEGNEVVKLPVMVVFGFGDSEHDTGLDVIAERGNIFPAEDHVKIHA